MVQGCRGTGTVHPCASYIVGNKVCTTVCHGTIALATPKGPATCWRSLPPTMPGHPPSHQWIPHALSGVPQLLVQACLWLYPLERGRGWAGGNGGLRVGGAGGGVDGVRCCWVGNSGGGVLRDSGSGAGVVLVVVVRPPPSSLGGGGPGGWGGSLVGPCLRWLALLPADEHPGEFH